MPQIYLGADLHLPDFQVACAHHAVKLLQELLRAQRTHAGPSPLGWSDSRPTYVKQEITERRGRMEAWSMALRQCVNCRVCTKPTKRADVQATHPRSKPFPQHIGCKVQLISQQFSGRWSVAGNKAADCRVAGLPSHWLGLSR